MTFSRFGFITLIGFLLGFLVSSTVASSLRYHPKSDQKIVYKVEVVAELPDKIETSEGVITYEATSTAEGLKLKYHGGLKQATKHKTDRRRGGFPPMPPISHGPMMLCRSYDGLANRTNTLVMTNRGEIRSLTGSSQMPYLLGNLSLLPFKRLPEEEKTSWIDNRGASVTEHSGSSRFGPRFFSERFGVGKHLTASEVASYKLQSKTDGIQKFQETYQLHCGDDQESIDMTGCGFWAFNEKVGMPESSEFKYNVVLKEEGITITVPVQVKYERLSDEALAAYEKERKEKEAKAKKQREEILAKRQAPLTESEILELMADLRSGESHRQRNALHKLSMKQNLQVDPQLIEAVQTLASSHNEWVRDKARDAISNLSPELKKKAELNKAYESFMPLEESEMGPVPTDPFSLPPGLLIATKKHHRWNAARIKKMLGHGTYEIEYQGSHQSGTVEWHNIRLAPPEVEQTFVDKAKLKKLYAHYAAPATKRTRPKTMSPKVGSAERGYRTWTDNSGTFTVVAKYVCTEGPTVFLQRKDGTEIKVPFARLCEKDRQIAELLKEIPAPTNPFLTNPFE